MSEIRTDISDKQQKLQVNLAALNTQRQSEQAAKNQAATKSPTFYKTVKKKLDYPRVNASDTMLKHKMEVSKIMNKF